MARPLPVEYPGAVYHVTARGNERRRTFRDDADRRRFLATLAEAVQEHGIRLHAYCLMPNDDAFGQALPSPRDEWPGGLALGGEAFFQRVRELLGRKPGLEEVR